MLYPYEQQRQSAPRYRNHQPGLIFSDMEVLERRIAKTTRAPWEINPCKRAGNSEKLYAHLENGNLAKSFRPEDEDELAFINTLDLLTWKPVIFAKRIRDDLADDGASMNIKTGSRICS